MAKKAAKKATAKKTAKKAVEVQKQPTHFQVRDTTTDHTSEFNILKGMIEKNEGLKKLKGELALTKIFALAKQQIENPSGEVLQYTKENFVDLPALYEGWKEDLSDIENITDCFKHMVVAINSLNKQNTDNQQVIIDLEKKLRQGVMALKPGEIVIDTTKISNNPNGKNYFTELQENFKGETIEEKFNDFLENTRLSVEAISKLPEQMHKAMQEKNLEIKGLQDQIRDQNTELEELNTRVDEIQAASVQLQDPEFICILDEEVTREAMKQRAKLIESGKITTEDPDEYPNALCNYAIKKLFDL